MLIVILSLLVLSFGFVLLRGAPYLPTKKKQIQTALDFAGLKEGQVLLELGSGDGAVLVEAARRGLHVVGYELNPILVLIAKIRCYQFRDQVSIIWGDYWVKQWPKSDAMYVFLLDKYMNKLDKKVTQYAIGQKYVVVSNTFLLPGRKPHKSRDGIHLYLYK